MSKQEDGVFKPKDFKDLVLWYRNQILSGGTDATKRVFLSLSEELLKGPKKVKTKLKKIVKPKEE